MNHKTLNFTKLTVILNGELTSLNFCFEIQGSHKSRHRNSAPAFYTGKCQLFPVVEFCFKLFMSEYAYPLSNFFIKIHKGIFILQIIVHTDMTSAI
jgi:hypothetical protein